MEQIIIQRLVRQGCAARHEFSGNITCILYYKAFQGIWLKTILQWGTTPFWCWNQLQLLTKWVLGFDVHNVNWLSIQPSWNSIHTDTDCVLGPSPWRLVVIVISCCELLLLHFLRSCIFSLIPICYCQAWRHLSRHLKGNLRAVCSLSRLYHRLCVYTV